MWGMMNGYGSNATGSADSVETHQQNLDSLLNQILKEQRISDTKNIDCSKISPGTFEKIGDAWMDMQINNKAAHERMDQMMGGEGSASLAQAHRKMGENYIGCAPENFGYSPMMGHFFWGGGEGSMMWGYGNGSAGGFGAGFGLLAFLFWLVVFIDLVLLGVFLWKKVRK